MMSTTLFCLAAFILTCTPIFGADSTRAKQSKPLVRLPLVEISTLRLSSNVERSISPTTILNTAQIRALGARQTADVLSFVPGSFVRNYGGMGGLKTLSLRGASAAQTAIFLDGVRVSSTQSGQFDFSTVPAAMLEEIEVLRGGAGALYGAGAMAGAVNMRTKSRITAPELTLTTEAASFQEFRAAVSGALPLSELGNSGIIGHAEGQTAQGNYPFGFNEFGRDTTLERVNTDARFFAASLLGFAQIHRWRVQGRVLARLAERGTPGAVVQGSVEMARARLGEEDVLMSLTANNAFTNQSLLTLVASAKFNTLHYRDPDARQFGTSGINERFLAQDWSASAKLHFDETVKSPFIALSHEFLFETTVSDLRGNMLQPGVGNRVQRVNIGFAMKGEARVQLADIPLQSNNPLRTTYIANELRMNAALRADSFSDAGTALSPLLGAAWVLDSLWTFRAQWSYNFRPPAFNELYYLNFGNSRLQPERSNCFTLGTSFLYPASILHFSSDIFYHRTENQIIAVQTSPFTVSAQNIEQVHTFGWETSVQAALSKSFSLQLNYTFQRAINETPSAFSRGKQLVYTPSHLASAVVMYQENWLQIGSTAQVVGERYTLPSNSIESRLPAFLTINLFAEGVFQVAPVQFRVRLQCDNLFDERYAVIRNFPMPSRAVRATVMWKLE